MSLEKPFAGYAPSSPHAPWRCSIRRPHVTQLNRASMTIIFETCVKSHIDEYIIGNFNRPVVKGDCKKMLIVCKHREISVYCDGSGFIVSVYWSPVIVPLHKVPSADQP